MNKPLLLLSTALLLTSTASALAASSTNLTVKGTITPSACEVEIPSGKVVDLGKISAKDLSPDRPTLIGDNNLQLKITCLAPTLIALQGIDNTGNAPDPYNYYGLGLVDGKQLGMYGLSVNSATEEGAAITMLDSQTGATWDELFPGDAWSRAHLVSFGDNSTGSWAPTPVKNVMADLRIQTIIARTEGMNLNTEIPFEGSATLEVKYL